MHGSNIAIQFSEDNLLMLNICLSLIMFGVSLGLTVDDFKQVLRQPKIVISGLLTQYIILPIIITGFCILIQPLYGFAMGMLLVICSPGGNMSNLLTKLGKGDVALSVTLTAISTIVSAFSIPILFNTFSKFLPVNETIVIQELSIIEMAKVVLILTAFPLAAGMLVTAFLPKVAEKMQGPMKVISLLIFFTFLVFAFIKNKDSFLLHLNKVFLLVLAANSIAFAVGYIITKISGGNTAQNRAVSIEMGIKNSGLSLGLVFNFWDGWGEPALIAAWWGIWHLLAGLLLTTFWSKRTH